ncbi:MAG: glutathione S-transferase [Alphaproteobacteria bacterium PA4]|nr:MAG: glutathione S-transferase [Alphaproteobacteria bacterium PA4]
MMLWMAADPAPNPRRVRLFLKAKGLVLPETSVSLFAREHKSATVLAKNPRGQVPFLELDDGRVIAETISICRYLDDIHPEPPLFGSDAFERAETDMWIRRAETFLGPQVSMAWQHDHPMTARLIKQIPEMGRAARAQAQVALAWFDEQLRGRAFLAGDRFSMADITLLTIFDFGDWIDIKAPTELAALHGWHARVMARLA